MIKKERKQISLDSDLFSSHPAPSCSPGDSSPPLHLHLHQLSGHHHPGHYRLVPLRLAVHWDLTGVFDPDALAAELGEELAVHLLQGEPEDQHVFLPLLVVGGEVLGEGVLLVPPLDRGDKGEGRQ